MSWRGLYWQGNIFFAFETPQCTLSLNEVCRYDWRFFNSDPRMLCSLKVLSACPLHSGFGSRLFPGTNPTIHSNFWAKSTSRNWDWRREGSGKVISCDGNINITWFGVQFWKFNRSWKWRVICAVSLLLHLPESHQNCNLVVFKCKSTLKRMALAGSQSSSSPPPCVALPPLQGGAANMRADDAILQINDKFT